MKVSKYKNVGLIFELLSKQLVSDIYESGDSPAAKIIKKYFHKNTEIGKEFQLMKIFNSDKINLSENQLNRIFPLVKETRKKIDTDKLAKEKFQLIKEIKSNYDLKDFFSKKVELYRLYGAIQMLFESNSLIQNIKCQDIILENLSKPKTPKEAELFEGVDTLTEKIAYKLLIEKFNQKYDSLNTKQKLLIGRYITEDNNSEKFRNYIIEEIQYITKKCKTISESNISGVLKIKINEATKLLEDLMKNNKFKDEHVDSMLKFYELIDIIK